MTPPTNPGQQVATDMAKILDDIFERNMANVFGTCSNTTADPGPPLTMQTIIDSMERVRQIMDEPPIRIPGLGANSLGFGGIRIIESTAAVRRERVKTYPKRKARTPAHWARMDKKWLKRYGWHEVPQAYMFNGDLSGMALGKGLFVHPSQAALLRNFR
jgi:hypothetical protein